MWFQFAPNEDMISVERQVFLTEYTDSSGANFFRAPDHFREKLIREGGCKALPLPPEGAPKNLPELKFPEPETVGDALLSLRQELSNERSTSSALRAEMGAVLHERDTLKLQVHELTEELNELKEKMAEEEPEVSAKGVKK